MSRRVLLMIDLQRGFVSDVTQSVIDYVGELLERERFDVIVQTRWENHTGSQYEKRLGYQGAGSSMETAMCFMFWDDHVITRTCYSCWDRRLQRLIGKDDELHIVGLETDACVMATLFSLWDNGYVFKVHERGVGTSRAELQQAALAMIRRQFGDGSVV